MNDAVIISDIHLGSINCRSKEVLQFLEDIHTGVIQTKCLIINGDLFDSIEFRRLNKHHWKVLSLIRKLSNDIKVIWIKGNHDEYANEVVSILIGSDIASRYIMVSGDKKILIVHGDIFDKFIAKYPFLTFAADWTYRLMQRFTHRFAKFLKRSSKTFLRCVQDVENKSVKLAEKLDCDIVCCGHTHMPISDSNHNLIKYFNSGCWVESPPTYLIVNDGKVELKYYLY